MSHDFSAELRLTKAFAKTRPTSPLALALTFRDYPEMTTRAEVSVVGAKGRVEVRMLAQQFFAGRLRGGMVFDGAAGGAAVARGILTAVANEALVLPEGVHPDSVNLHGYPRDILERIEADFGVRAPLAFRDLQTLVGALPSVRQPRILRAILHLAAGDAEALDDAIALAAKDYRDLIMAAEYGTGAEGETVRLRDLTKGF